MIGNILEAILFVFMLLIAFVIVGGALKNIPKPKKAKYRTSRSGN